MSVAMQKNQIDRYGLRCRRLSRLLLIVTFMFVFILQGMCFFVALDGGYDSDRALIFSLIPLAGPLFCGFQLVIAGTGTPLILFALFIPCALPALGSAYFSDQYKLAVYEASKPENPVLPDALDILTRNPEKKRFDYDLESQPKAPPAAQPLPVKQPAPEPRPLPVKPEKTQPQPVKKNGETNNAVKQPLERATVKTENDIPYLQKTEEYQKISSEPSPRGTGSDRESNEEYDKMLRDVLSILNKQ